MSQNSRRRRRTGLTLLAALMLACSLPASAAEETKQQKDKRMAWWREARFGMFIHWGLYAVPAGTWKGKKVGGIGEWIMNRGKITVADYEKLATQFNPVKFDARQWARIAKGAGMKYMVITSKHHDGFCLWDSKLTEYDIMSGPFKRDLLKELTAACKAEGVRMCFYHSIMDWHHPDYLPRRGWDKRPGVEAKYERFIKYLKGQVKELIENYDPGVLWFDGEWEKTWTHEHGKMMYDHVLALKPDALVNNRVDKGRRGMQGMTRSAEFAGDFGTPEQEIPHTGFPPGVDWETCMTMNKTWGFKSYDHAWKGTSDLLRKLADIASKGGNFLLNVGPTAEGLIPAPSVKRLAEMGKWMDVNGESIYGTTANPFKKTPWGRCTKKPGKLYLHVFTWPAKGGAIQLAGLKSKVTKAYLLTAKDKPLTVSATADPPGCAITGLPDEAPDKINSVIVVEYEGDLDVAAVVGPAARPAADGTVTLKAADAELHGAKIKFESEKNCVGYWINAADWVSWDVKIDKPGEFTVELTFACDADSGGSQVVIAVGKRDVTGTIEPTGTWDKFEKKALGKLEIDKAGTHKVTVRAKKKPNLAVMNLRTIKLAPAK